LEQKPRKFAPNVPEKLMKTPNIQCTQVSLTAGVAASQNFTRFLFLSCFSSRFGMPADAATH
jgi:hypothetical protein